MASQPKVTFPGIIGVIDANFTLSHGPTPGLCSLTIVPQTSTFPEVGTLMFEDGSTRFVFPNMKVDQGSYSLDQQGMVVRLNLFDRRWMWQFGAVSGVYNMVQSAFWTRTRQTRNIAHGRRNAKQLCTYLLNAMGEVGFDVSQVPETVFPEVEWDATNTAQALSEVVEQCACRIVLRLNNTVQIARMGFGAALPPGPIISGGEGANPAERPSSIQAVCERSLFEIPLPLAPVGETEDGTIAHIDDLSYRPVGGWESLPLSMSADWVTVGRPAVPGGPPAIPGGAVTRAQKDLAKKSVYKWYSIYLPFTEGRGRNQRRYLPIVDYGRIYEIEQILPLMPYRMSDASRNDLLVDNGTEFKDPKIFGQMAQPARSGLGLNTWNTGAVVALSTRYPNYVKFNLDTERGLVMFEKPMAKVKRRVGFGVPAGSAGWVVTAWDPASLYLDVAFSVRDLATWAPHRYTFTVPVPGAPLTTQPRILHYPGIHYQSINYHEDGTNVFGMPDGFRGTSYNNAHLIRGELQAACQAELQRYAGGVTAEASYAGFLPISPDGAIQQVTWSHGQGGSFTRASRNNEYNFSTPAYKLRRQLYRLGNADFTVIRR